MTKKRARHLDKLHKRREKIIKGVKEQLKSALSAHDETHPQYKRNIKNLYEGLVRMELIDAIDNPINLNQFKEAFKNANKKLREALVVANLLNNRNLNTYYTYGDKNKKIGGFRLIGNKFMVETVNTALEENQALKYILDERKLADTLKALEELKVIKKVWSQISKDFKKGLRGTEKTLWKIADALNTYERMFLMKPKDSETNEQLFHKLHRIGLGDEEKLTEEHIELRKEGLNREQLVDEANEAIQEIINAGRAIGKKTKDAMQVHHNLEAELATKVKFKQDKLHTDLLANLQERLRLTQLQLHDKIKQNQSEQEGIPNMVQQLTDVIELKNYLSQVIEFAFTNQAHIKVPGQLIGFGSGGLDKRSADMDVEEVSTGNTQQGFGAKDGNNTFLKLQEIRKVLLAYEAGIPESNFKDEIHKLGVNLLDLVTTFSSLRQSIAESLIEATSEETITRNLDGQIDFYEHRNVMDVFEDIKQGFSKVIGTAQRASEKGIELQAYNEELIDRAKKEDKSAQKALLDIARKQDKLDRIIAQRKAQEIKDE